jgi:hypothetical protein
MRRWLRLSALGGVVLAACAEPPSAPRQASQQTQAPTPAQQPAFTPANPVFGTLFASPGEHVHILPTRGAFAGPLMAEAMSPFARHGGGGGRGTGINYHGGPIILTPRIAAIYWYNGTLYAGGPAANTSGGGGADGSLVGLFMRSLGGTGYWNINNTYTNGSGQPVPNSLSYTQYWADGASAPASGANVSDASVQAEVERAFTSGALTFDAATLYAVFSGPGVNLGGGFGTQYCAYHGHFSWNGNDVKYAVMPYNITYPSACTDGSGISPTSDYAAAAEVNTLAHETEETMTDEDLNAWYDTRGYENADKCAWNFGTTHSGTTGVYNQTMGGVNWLIQMNWVNANSGGCLQHWP